MYVIINCDPVTGQLIEVIGPFDNEVTVNLFIIRHNLQNTIITTLSAPDGFGD